MEVPEYELPEAAIAQEPVEPRDSARLLDATDPTGGLVHRHVRNLDSLIRPGDVVVVNSSRVIPARLRMYKETGGAAEVLIIEPDAHDARTWTALVRPGGRLPPGTKLAVDKGGRPDVEVGERRPGGQRTIRFVVDSEVGVNRVVDACGTVALPPYIHSSPADPERYQTVYADQPGSIAAPTAGLHLTHELLQRCRDRGAQVKAVDLAVGVGTFRPVVASDAMDHVMHCERYRVPAATWEACRRARRVVAVGTTTVRALETAAQTGRLEGRTDLYIRPGFDFGMVDVLLTNFHLPRSTLLLLLEAFCGPRWRDLYAQALKAGYRFLSFGDAMIVARS